FVKNAVVDLIFQMIGDRWAFDLSARTISSARSSSSRTSLSAIRSRWGAVSAVSVTFSISTVFVIVSFEPRLVVFFTTSVGWNDRVALLRFVVRIRCVILFPVSFEVIIWNDFNMMDRWVRDVRDDFFRRLSGRLVANFADDF